MASVTTRTITQTQRSWPGEAPLDFIPTSLYCYEVGRNLTRYNPFLSALRELADTAQNPDA